MKFPSVRSLALTSLLSLLSLAAVAQPPAQTASSPADGIWLGRLGAGPQALRLQLHLKVGAAGAGNCALDSLDQGAPGIPCNNEQVSGTAVSFDVPVVQGKFSGTPLLRGVICW